MAVAIRRDLVLCKPVAGIGLDFSHPLAQALVLCVVFNQGAGLTVQDLTGNPRHQFLGSSSGIGWLPSPDIGPATDISGTGVWTATAPSDTPFLGDITIVWRGVVDTGGALREFVNKSGADAATANPFTFYTNTDANPRPRLTRANTTYRGWITPTTGFNAGVLNKVQTFAVSQVAAIETAPLFYINGMFSGPAVDVGPGAGTGAPTGSSKDIRIGQAPSIQMDGKVDFVMIWNRVLTPSEHLWLATEPYTFMLPPAPWRRWFLPQTSVLDLSAYRWRDDDGNEAAASWLAAENTSVSRAQEQNTRLRVQIDADGDPGSRQYKLQYRKVGNDEWIDVEP